MGTVGTESGLASGILNSSQQVGNALALAALATTAAVWTGVLLDREVSDDAALTGGYQTGFLVAASFTIAGAAAALGLPRGTTGQRPDMRNDQRDVGQRGGNRCRRWTQSSQ